MEAAKLWKPTDPRFIADPYPVYKELHRLGPVFKAPTGDYVVIGYRECKQILQNSDFKTGLRKDWMVKIADYAKPKGLDFKNLQLAISSMPIQMNPPEHADIRSAMAHAWPTQIEIKALAKKYSEKLVAELPIEFDAVDALCRRLPLYMISALLGLPLKEALNRAGDGLKLVQLLDPYLTYQDLLQIKESSEKLRAFISDSMSNSKFQLTPLSEALIKLGKEGHDDVGLMVFLFIAGFETTASLLATCLYHLLQNRTLREKIIEGSAQAYVREILRRYSPVQVTGRIVPETMWIGGLEIPKNAALTLCIGAANVDPHHYDQPELVNMDKKQDFLSFGYGIHHCLGSQLAELEAEALIKAVLPILPLQVKTEPTMESRLSIRSYQSLLLSGNE
ncbi:MAG: cytochrome P450 [Ekhidna sp.]